MKLPSPNDPPRFIVTARQLLLAEFVEAVMQGVPLLALTAAAGAGKTTFASAVQQELASRSVHVLRIGRGESGRIDLRTVACQVLGKSEAEFNADDIEALFDVMTARQVPDQKLVLIVDDAELLGTDVLGYLRLLCSIASEEMPQVVFVGRPSFWDLTDHPNRADIRELIADRRELAPLSEEEARTFVEISLPVSVLGDGALDALVRHGNGLIGRIASLLVLANGGNDNGHVPQLTVAAIDTAVAALDAGQAAVVAAVQAEHADADAISETSAVAAESTSASTPTADHSRRRLRFAPTLGVAMVTAAIGIALYWQAFVGGDRMWAQAGPIHEMAVAAATAPSVAPQARQTAQASSDVSVDASPTTPAPVLAPSSVDADGLTIGEQSPVPVPPPHIDQTWLLADTLDDMTYSATANAAATEQATQGPLQSVPVGTPSDPAVQAESETPVQPIVSAATIIAPIDIPSLSSTAAQQDTMAPPVMPQRDNPPLDAPAPAVRTEAPDNGPSISNAAAAGHSSAEAGSMIDAPADDTSSLSSTAVQQDPIAPPAMPQRDNPPPDAPAPAVQREAPDGGTSVLNAAVAERSSAEADGTSAPRIVLPAAKVISLNGSATAERPGDRRGATATATGAAPDLSPLLSRGDAMLALGDVAAARLFYERAAALGSASGATSLGKTYDPAFLASIQATSVTPDRDLAASWYRRGAALGDMEGRRRLAMLTANQ